ncbi:MAG: TIGR03435 family protein, partial [Acidobacteriia bacterium]|nr:TIGR03435 family protein [Terriglobia bacterium]
ASASSLPRLLRSAVDKPIIDQTGLSGEYEIELDFSLDTSPALTDTTPPLSDLFRAIQQLGLRLEPKRLPMDVIVVDSANKTPSEN